MATTVNPELLDDIKRYGAFDISACFNCGNCTAICPLSDEHGSFPRKLIRLGQIGDRSRLVTGSEAWLCYYCGECSETCPRQAEPGEYMAALRRYSIASYEPTGVAGWMYKSTGIALVVMLGLFIILGVFLVGLKPETSTAHYAQEWLFKRLVPYEVIHTMGIGIFAVTTLVLVWGALTAFRQMGRGMGKRRFSQIRLAMMQTGKEIALMKRHREDLDGPDRNVPFLLRPSTIHKSIMFGFGGLLAATVLDFLFIVMIPLGTTFWPARILGIVSGVALMFGVLAASVRRLRKTDKNSAYSTFADVWLLFFLFMLGITGFWLLGVVSFHQVGTFNDVVLLVHAAMAMELVLLMAFSKLAHVIYRPIALFTYFLRSNP